MGMETNHTPSDNKQAYPTDWAQYFTMRWWLNHFTIREGIAVMREKEGSDAVWQHITPQQVRQLEIRFMNTECSQPEPCLCLRCFE